VLLVLDKSSSMNSALPGGTTTRWDAMRSALDTVLRKASLTINFGLDLFPAANVPDTCPGDTCCAMPASSEPSIFT
jgi:hypothetical protein